VPLKQVHLDEITVVVGSLGSITLTLILPPLLYNAVRKPKLLRRTGHWIMSSFWTIILVSGNFWTLINWFHPLVQSLFISGRWHSDCLEPAGLRQECR
jgi:hypothetical protein